VPVVAEFGRGWLERGSMQVRFHQPFYDGDEVIVRCEVDSDSEPLKIIATASRDSGEVCASMVATVDEDNAWLGEPRLEDYPAKPLPPIDARRTPSRETLKRGTMLGALTTKLDLTDTTLLESINERLPIYYGASAVAHPIVLLSLANQILMRNFRLGPWIHAASDLVNWSTARDGERISVRGCVRDCYERKGHEFVVLNLLLVANDNASFSRSAIRQFINRAKDRSNCPMILQADIGVKIRYHRHYQSKANSVADHSYDSVCDSKG
jgi:hypothetical protein